MMRTARFGAAAILAIAVTIPPATTRADELSRTDKLRVLYSNQFAFDRRGIPLITIAIAEDTSAVTIEGDKGLRVLPDGEDGSEIRAGQRWKVVLEKGRQAEVDHFAVLDRRPAASLGDVPKLTATWSERGAKPRVIEIGTVFGVKGQVFDNRAFLLADGPYPTHDKAQQRAEAFARKHGMTRPTTIAQLRHRPSATLRATDPESGARIKVRDAIWFASASHDNPLTVRVDGGEGRAFWGQVYVTVSRKGRLAVVNAVAADKLLAGLVPAEIFASAPAAALGAQAVAARGDLLAKIGTRHLIDPYLICSWQHCQVYRGAGFEQRSTSKAVAATRGVVLQRRGGGLVKAVYSAHCGGHTEDNDHAWPAPADPTLRGKLDAERASAPFAEGITNANVERWITARPDSWCARSGVNRDKLRWRVRLTATRISEMVKPLGIGPVSRIEVLARGRSGRVTRIRVSGALGKREVRGELTIRRLFGGLRSSMVLVQPVRNAGGRLQAYDFIGGGWGHGVGMCQTGAIGMARAGRTFRQILQHYYTSSELRRVY